jgi:hypothetical protein
MAIKIPNGHKIPNGRRIDHKAIKYIKHIFNCKTLQILKFTQIGIFSLKIHHLVALLLDKNNFVKVHHFHLSRYV